jgi:hypothetical protein
LHERRIREKWQVNGGDGSYMVVEQNPALTKGGRGADHPKSEEVSQDREKLEGSWVHGGYVLRLILIAVGEASTTPTCMEPREETQHPLMGATFIVNYT